METEEAEKANGVKLHMGFIKLGVRQPEQRRKDAGFKSYLFRPAF
jgi:hypothetical protein